MKGLKAIATKNEGGVGGRGTGIKGYGGGTGFISKGNVREATGGGWYRDVPQMLGGARLADIRG